MLKTSYRRNRRFLSLMNVSAIRPPLKANKRSVAKRYLSSNLMSIGKAGVETQNEKIKK
jgi:hypothetical protein